MMLHRFGRVSLFLAAAALAFSSLAAAEIWKNVTVIDVQGWEYEGVSVERVPDSPNLKIISATGGHRFIPLSRVRVIRDGEGRDITREVLPDGAPPGGGDVGQPGSPAAPGTAGPGESKTNAAPTPKRERISRFYGPRFRISLGAFLGAGTPSGDWFEYMEGGLAFGFRSRIAYADNFYLGFSYLRQSLGVSSSFNDYLGMDLDWEAHLSELYFLAGAMTGSSKPKTPIAFGEFGFGAAKHHIEAKGDVGGTLLAESSDESKFSLLMAAGVIVPFSPSIGAELEGDMRITGEGESTGAILGITFGITALFGH
ncbi:MAG: hypothetical protein ABIK65_02325 [Candidatus Eisenbacteria bacterium]